VPKVAHACQTKGARAQSSARGGQTEGAQAQGSTRLPNGGRTFLRENLCFLGIIWGFQSKIWDFPQRIWGFQRERAHAKLSAHVPKVARAGRTEGVQAQAGARMRIKGDACPREHARANRKERKLG